MEYSELIDAIQGKRVAHLDQSRTSPSTVASVRPFRIGGRSGSNRDWTQAPENSV